MTAADRRTRLVARHRLNGSATDATEVAASLVALHATDPATVYLSVLARSASTTIADIGEALHGRRELVRWMAMRRTVFVFLRDDVPLVQAAVGAPLAAALRRRLVARIARNGIDPPIDGDPSEWLAAVEERVEKRVGEAGSITGSRLREVEPALRARIRDRLKSETPQALTSPLLTVLSTEGRLVRGAPIGAWTTRTQAWEPISTWWPDGIPILDPAEARVELVRRYLARFGPATADDVQWWTGWTKTATRAALDRLELEEVDLDGIVGVDLVGRSAVAVAEPVAALLPALDPTPMGWRHRDWFTPAGREVLYDTAGNIGPTLWWDGEIVGGWASTPRGIRLEMTVDRGREAAGALDAAAERLERRLDGTVVTPAARTPLERRLAGVIPASGRPDGR